jgi:hypothetical protein
MALNFSVTKISLWFLEKFWVVQWKKLTLEKYIFKKI